MDKTGDQSDYVTQINAVMAEDVSVVSNAVSHCRPPPCSAIVLTALCVCLSLAGALQVSPRLLSFFYTQWGKPFAVKYIDAVYRCK
jgi:hypothetical protein